MDAVVDLGEWRRARRGPHPAYGSAVEDGAEVSRLEQAVDRLHSLVSKALDTRGRLEPQVETELLAIVGELSVGLVTDAASRAEHLADRLAGWREAPPR